MSAARVALLAALLAAPASAQQLPEELGGVAALRAEGRSAVRGLGTKERVRLAGWTARDVKRSRIDRREDGLNLLGSRGEYRQTFTFALEGGELPLRVRCEERVEVRASKLPKDWGSVTDRPRETFDCDVEAAPGAVRWTVQMAAGGREPWRGTLASPVDTVEVRARPKSCGGDPPCHFDVETADSTIAVVSTEGRGRVWLRAEEPGRREGLIALSLALLLRDELAARAEELEERELEARSR